MKELYLVCILISCLFYNTNAYAQAASIMWPLTSNTSFNAPIGNIQGTNETIGVGPSPSMSVFSYNNGQRLWMGNTGWAANSTIVLSRYIQFDASPTSGNNFTVTSFSFNYGDIPLAADYNILKFQAAYSTDNFSTSTILNATPLFYLNSTMSTYTATNLNIPVANGQTFSLRIYPYSPNGGVPAIPSFAIHDTVVINGTTSASTKPSFCTDFENNLTGGWQVNNTLATIITEGNNHYIQTTDQSGASYFYNASKDYTGDWGGLLTDSCGSLCWDVNYLYAGDGNDGSSQPITMTPYITIIGNGDTASFVTNSLITAGDGWHSYCAPIRYLNPDGSLPSNSDGHWIMSNGSISDWNTLLSNVTTVRLPVDPTSYQNERFGYDNICIKNTGDCTPPPQFGSICGIKFNDLNGNGVKDPGEPGLQNWIINLNYQTVAGNINLTDTTDLNGNYCFENLTPGGTYTIFETNQNGWSRTFPTPTGTYTIPLTSGEHKDSVNFGNHLLATSLCDSLKATASKITPGDCNWSLSLQQPANLTGIFGIQISCLSPNQFTTGTGLGPNFQNWFASSNTYYPPTGHVPGGNLNDFFHMNINYTTSPQVIVVNWLDSLSKKVCSDTLRLDCRISCTTILNDTIVCAGNNYNFSYRFTNNATYSISNIEYTLQSPSGVTISPLADTLSPALAANATSSAQKIQISGGMPGDTVVIVAKFISSGGCCWCFETFNVILPSCASVCDSLSVSATGSSADCCYSISLTNNSSTVFSSVEFQLLSGGMYSTVSTTSAPGWAFTNVSPNYLINLVKLPFGQGIGHGIFNSVLDMCIRQYPDSNQVIAVKWVKDGKVICTDTLRFECVQLSPKTDTCSQVINGTLTCLKNGTVQYVFRVQNNSVINSTGFGIFPMTPGVSFSKTIFNNTNILPGQVSPIDTIIISGIGLNHQVCLQTSIFVTVDSLYNYCCHSDTVCISTPNCNTKDTAEACITWGLLSDQSITSIIGNINGTPESIGVGSSSPFMSIFLPYISTGQRLWVGNTGWITSPIDAMRYIEFDASPNMGNNFTVTNISFNYGDLPLGTDFNIINFKAYYSTDAWVNSTVLNATALIYKNTAMLSLNQVISVSVPNGKTFSLRIYPYAIQNSVAMTPTFAIHNNVMICGTTSSVTSIEEGKTGSIMPKSFQLEQNYPNPFNPSSIILYDIPKTSFVRISVYDILGREVRVLVNEEKSPGEYSVVFDARNLASGIYFYAIRSGGFKQFKKMILMK